MNKFVLFDILDCGTEYSTEALNFRSRTLRGALVVCEAAQLLDTAVLWIAQTRDVLCIWQVQDEIAAGVKAAVFMCHKLHRVVEEEEARDMLQDITNSTNEGSVYIVGSWIYACQWRCGVLPGM